MNEQDATEQFGLSLNRDELILLSNALNEVCHGIHFTDDEFHTRLGSSREQTLAILQKFARALDHDPTKQGSGGIRE